MSVSGTSLSLSGSRPLWGGYLSSYEYFLLRVARYYQKYPDPAFVKKIWPACQWAMDYLVGRCVVPSALPEQQSYWADWKDVHGVTGRRFGPHFTGLYLASLQEMAKLARVLGETQAAAKWDAAYAAGHKQMNLPVEKGGDFLPQENLHGEDGRCIRKYIQGWDAAYLGAIMALKDALIKP